MSGAGRNSSYRKHITENFLSDFIVPEDNEQIVQVKANRGSNIFEVETTDGKVELARLPNKFNKLIWVKKNDFLIVEQTLEDVSSLSVQNSSASNLSDVKHVLSKDHIRYLKDQAKWPPAFQDKIDLDGKEAHNSSFYCSMDELMPDYVEVEDDDNEDSDDDNDSAVVIDAKGNTVTKTAGDS